jgi:hypothetical protein
VQLAMLVGGASRRAHRLVRHLDGLAQWAIASWKVERRKAWSPAQGHVIGLKQGTAGGGRKDGLFI